MFKRTQLVPSLGNSEDVQRTVSTYSTSLRSCQLSAGLQLLHTRGQASGFLFFPLLALVVVVYINQCVGLVHAYQQFRRTRISINQLYFIYS